MYKTDETLPDTSDRIIRLRVRGEKAVFCGPKKDEPVSYPAPTPSAARGIMEAIFWKPAIFWHVRRIHILKPIRWFEVRVNELKGRMNETRAVKQIEEKRGDPRVVIEEERDQRHILGLKDVDYVFEAVFSFTSRRGIDESAEKFQEMFLRRLEKGQCFFNPYMGRRDYPAYFEPAPPRFTPPAELHGKTIDLGMMLLDQKFGNDTAVPQFFDAQIKNGVLVEAGSDTLPFFACQGRLHA
jgi:CRISPR-associated protein Cas5d